MNTTTTTTTTTPSYKSDIEGIRDTLRYFCDSADMTELRCLNVFPFRGADTKAGTVGGWYTHIGDLADDACKLGEFGEGAVYFTLNPVTYGQNKAQLNKSGVMRSSSTDKDIMLRRWLFLDFDPTRPDHCSSTDAEKAVALACMDGVIEWLSERGFSGHATADSGNGYHLYYHIDMAASSENDALVKAFTALISGRFGTEDVKIDTVVYNLARITRLYGTWNRKGQHSDQRPHRLSRLLTPCTAPWIKVARECIEGVIAELAVVSPKAVVGKSKKPALQAIGAPFPIEAWLEEHGVGHKPGEPMPDGRIRYILDACPFDPSHEGKDAAVFQGMGGMLGFKCFHDSCAENGWKQLRKHLEPDYDPEAGEGDGSLAEGGETALLYLMLEDKFAFRRNVLTGQTEYQGKGGGDWKEFGDTEVNTVKVMAVREWGLTKTRVGEVWEYTNSLYVPSYHPVRDYLHSLTWDGTTDHIAELRSLVKTENDDLWALYLRAWLIRAVDQALTGTANEYMLLLSGPQGTGKNTFAEALVPSILRKSHLKIGKIDSGDKDGLAMLVQMFVVCDDELNGMKKQEASSIKAMLSLSSIPYRPPYGRTIVTRPRLASFIGLTNEDRFLGDPTGSRRFLALETREIDHVALRAFNTSGVWAQAVALYNGGERGYLDSETRGMQTNLNEEKADENVFDYYVSQYANESADKKEWCSTTELAHHISEMLAEKKANATINNAWIKQLGSSLKKAGHKQDRNCTPLRWKIAKAFGRAKRETVLTRADDPEVADPCEWVAVSEPKCFDRDDWDAIPDL